MSGRHSFAELMAGLSPERRRRIDAMKRELLAELSLHQLRQARDLTRGRLRIVAEFPEGDSAIPNFSQAGEAEAEEGVAKG